MTDANGTAATTTPPAVVGRARTDWADAVAGLRARRAQAAVEDREDWAAAADLRVLFAGRDSATGNGTGNSTPHQA